MEELFKSYEYLIKGLSAVGTLIIAFIAIYIAWRQWITAESKRKQDLFEKRWQFYIKVKKEFIDDFVEKAEDLTPESKSTEKYIRKHWLYNYTDEAYFLFGKDIEKHIIKTPAAIIEKSGKNRITDPVLSFRKPFEKYLILK